MDRLSIPEYHLIRKIGSSALSDVYLAEHETSGKSFAVKVLNCSQGNNISRIALTRFDREYHFQSTLSHCNIAPIHQRIEFPNHICHILDFFPGGDLSLRLSHPYDVLEALNHFLQLMSALEYIHEQEVLHLDIKPKNILCREDGKLALTDFGIAAKVQVSNPTPFDDTIIGSPYYMSPEQIDNDKLDQRSDLYSLGIIFYEMLAGIKPFTGRNLIQIFSAHLNEPIPTLPHEALMFQPIIDGLLAKQLTHRFANIKELRQALRDIDLIIDQPLDSIPA